MIHKLTRGDLVGTSEIGGKTYPQYDWMYESERIYQSWRAYDDREIATHPDIPIWGVVNHNGRVTLLDADDGDPDYPWVYWEPYANDSSMGALFVFYGSCPTCDPGPLHFEDILRVAKKNVAPPTEDRYIIYKTFFDIVQWVPLDALPHIKEVCDDPEFVEYKESYNYQVDVIMRFVNDIGISNAIVMLAKCGLKHNLFSSEMEIWAKLLIDGNNIDPPDKSTSNFELCIGTAYLVPHADNIRFVVEDLIESQKLSINDIVGCAPTLLPNP